MFDLDNIEDIKGYSTLGENQEEIFKKFIPNFLSSFGIDCRQTIIPISIKFIQSSEGKYLKFVYEINETREWMHVTNPTNWH